MDTRPNTNKKRLIWQSMSLPQLHPNALRPLIEQLATGRAHQAGCQGVRVTDRLAFLRHRCIHNHRHPFPPLKPRSYGASLYPARYPASTSKKLASTINRRTPSFRPPSIPQMCGCLMPVAAANCSCVKPRASRSSERRFLFTTIDLFPVFSMMGLYHCGYTLVNNNLACVTIKLTYPNQLNKYTPCGILYAH